MWSHSWVSRGLAALWRQGKLLLNILGDDQSCPTLRLLAREKKRKNLILSCYSTTQRLNGESSGELFTTKTVFPGPGKRKEGGKRSLINSAAGFSESVKCPIKAPKDRWTKTIEI